MNQKLNIFISSTSDLKRWRKASEKALTELNINGLKFESWSSSSNNPENECLLNVEESDGLLLIIGKKYGSLTNDGISFAHLEFRHAIKHKKPIFVYLLKNHKFSSEQIEFINEIKQTKFCCKSVDSLNNLQEEIKGSFIKEFTRCFRKVHSPPDIVINKACEVTNINNKLQTIDEKSSFELLSKLFTEGNDVKIYKYSNDCLDKFSNSHRIMNIIYMSTVNLGINGCSVDKSQIDHAICFWLSEKSKNSYAKFSLNYNLGNAYLALSDYENAIKYLKKSIKENKNFAECWHNLGSAYKGKREYILALKSYQQSLKINPKLFNSLLSIAIYYFRIEKEPKQAIHYLDRISVAQLPLKYKSHVLGWKAYINLYLGNYDAGITNAEDALHYDQDEDWIWSIAGRLYALVRVQDKNWLELSEFFWKKFVNKYPINPEAWAELGFIYWFLNIKEPSNEIAENCLSSFEKAIDIGFDDDGLVYDRVGHLYQDRNNYKKAERAFRKAASKSLKDFGYCLGVSLILLGKYQEALKYVLDAAEKYQPDELSWFQVAHCYDKLGIFDKAEESYMKSIELNNDYPEAYFNLGGLYWNNNIIDKAIITWRIALEKFPTHELCSQAKGLLNSIE